MENNNPIIPAAPTPSTSSMPEFAAAPAAPAPVVPPATTMPEFGSTQPTAQPITANPAQPVDAAQPAAPVDNGVPTAAVEAAAESSATEAIASTLGEILSEPVATAPAEPQTTPTAESVTTDVPSPVESTTPIESQPTSTQTVSPNPTPENPAGMKKPNMKLIAIIGVVAVALIGGIVAMLIISNQPTTTQNPDANPVSTYDEAPDNSKNITELDKHAALAYRTADGKTTKYFPTNLIGDDDQDVFALESEIGTTLLLYYEDAEKAKESSLTTDFLASIKGGKATKDSFEYTTKDDYVIVTPADAEAECTAACRGIAFDSKVLNHYNFVPTTGDPTVDAMATPVPVTVFTKLDEDTLKRYLPILAYITNLNVAYNADFASTDLAYTYTLHSLAVEVDQAALATAEAGVVPYVIKSYDRTISVDKTTGAVIYGDILAGSVNISVSSEEVADLI